MQMSPQPSHTYPLNCPNHSQTRFPSHQSPLRNHMIHQPQIILYHHSILHILPIRNGDVIGNPTWQEWRFPKMFDIPSLKGKCHCLNISVQVSNSLRTMPHAHYVTRPITLLPIAPYSLMLLVILLRITLL